MTSRLPRPAEVIGFAVRAWELLRQIASTAMDLVNARYSAGRAA